MKLSNAINQLRAERERVSSELQRIETAIVALRASAGVKGGGRRRGGVSTAARARIAAAQRARWAKWRKQKKVK